MAACVSLLSGPAIGAKLPPAQFGPPFDAKNPPYPEPTTPLPPAAYTPGVAGLFAEPRRTPPPANAFPTTSPFMLFWDTSKLPSAPIIPGPTSPTGSFPEPAKLPPPATVGPWIEFPEPTP